MITAIKDVFPAQRALVIDDYLSAVQSVFSPRGVNGYIYKLSLSQNTFFHLVKEFEKWERKNSSFSLFSLSSS